MAYRPTEKTEAHKRARNKSLLDAAIKVVAKEGFQALTISAVADEASVATGTVYKYFENKAHLCTEVFRAGSGREVEQVQAAAFPKDRSKSCRERLSDAITIFAQRALAGHRFAYALIAEPVDPMVEAERLKYRHAYAGIFSSLIEEGMDRQEFALQDPVLTAAAIVGALAETLVGPLGIGAPASGQFNEQQLIDGITTFCLKAVQK